MQGRTKLGWADIPRQSLRKGLACGEGGARIMLLMGDDRHTTASPAGTTAPDDAPPDARMAGKSR
jgi:hypothetical protein